MAHLVNAVDLSNRPLSFSRCGPQGLNKCSFCQAMKMRTHLKGVRREWEMRMWEHKVYTTVSGTVVKPLVLDAVATISGLFSSVFVLLVNV